MQASQVLPYQKWHWAGDEIVPNPIIPASRKVPGTNKARYPIDIREYLSIKDNAVVRRELHRLLETLTPPEREPFFSSQAGHFDYRADRVAEYVGRLNYLPVGRGFDHWLFPDETLANGGGDCEDLAFLLAALLLAAGISSYCVRVALGSVTIQEPRKIRRFDHAWVVYHNEDGGWEILEPLAVIAQSKRGGSKRDHAVEAPAPAVEYTPYFVFNPEHLWRVRGPETAAARPFNDYLGDRTFWNKFDPTFAAGVHNSIYDEALQGMAPADLARVKRASFWVDVNVLAYDPRDHFDFAYVAEGWQRAKARLATGDLRDFGLATHSIADFYAHTLYGEFGPQQPDGTLAPYDPDAPVLATAPAYDFHGCDLPGCGLGADAAAQHWNGQLISGQWWRWYSTFPDDLQHTADFKQFRRCLPDHDFLAVDSPGYAPPHRYTAAEHARQFPLRKAAAIAHIRATYADWKSAHVGG